MVLAAAIPVGLKLERNCHPWRYKFPCSSRELQIPSSRTRAFAFAFTMKLKVPSIEIWTRAVIDASSPQWITLKLCVLASYYNSVDYSELNKLSYRNESVVLKTCLFWLLRFGIFRRENQ